MELTGLDAALGLAEVQARLVGAATGAEDPAGYFALFRNSALIGKDSHTWLRDTVVTNVDDHDLVRQGSSKSRLCSTFEGRALALGVIAMNVLTLGIPCLYYGTEQRLDGGGGPPVADRYIREALFGGAFGAFRSRGRHVFDEAVPTYSGAARPASRGAGSAAGAAVPARDLGGRHDVRPADGLRRAGPERGGVVADPGPARGVVRDQHRSGAGADRVGDGRRGAACGGGVVGAPVRQRGRAGLRGGGRGAQRVRGVDQPAAGRRGGVRLTAGFAKPEVRRGCGARVIRRPG
jgi:hypothetical protein